MAKNHWLRRREERQKQIWTAEFFDIKTSLLAPRRIGVEDPQHSLGFLGADSGETAVVFDSSMLTSDDELFDFLSLAQRNRMSGWLAILRHYSMSLMNELEFFVLGGLGYISLERAHGPDHMRLSFGFTSVQRSFIV